MSPCCGLKSFKTLKYILNFVYLLDKIRNFASLKRGAWGGNSASMKRGAWGATQLLGTQVLTLFLLGMWGLSDLSIGDNSKSKGLRLFKFFDFSNTCSSLLAQSGTFIPTAWVLRQTAWMPYFTFTRLNLYLDLLSVIGFRHFKALLKVLNKRMQIAQFLRIYFAQIFAQLTFSVFLEFWSFCKYFSIFEFTVNFKKHVKLFIFRALFCTGFDEQLDLAINI